MLWTIVIMVGLTGICSLGVDWGRVSLAKTELSRAADAAAHAASKTLSSSTTTAARAQAMTVAGYHTVDGTAVNVQSGDIVFGKWNSSTLTLNTASAVPDAVQVTLACNSSRGNAISPGFARLIHKPYFCDNNAGPGALVSRIESGKRLANIFGQRHDHPRRWNVLVHVVDRQRHVGLLGSRDPLHQWQRRHQRNAASI